MTRVHVPSLAIACCIAAACAKPASRSADSAANSAASTTSAAASGAAQPPCPRTGHWSECQIRTRLEQSGLAPRTATDKPDLPALTGTPVTLVLGTSPLAVWFYPDTLARRRAAATLDTGKFIPPTRDVSMRGETTVIENDNALALLFSRNEHQRERVSDAITAGPPQP